MSKETREVKHLKEVARWVASTVDTFLIVQGCSVEIDTSEGTVCLKIVEVSKTQTPDSLHFRLVIQHRRLLDEEPDDSAVDITASGTNSVMTGTSRGDGECELVLITLDSYVTGCYSDLLRVQ